MAAREQRDKEFASFGPQRHSSRRCSRGASCLVVLSVTATGGVHEELAALWSSVGSDLPSGPRCHSKGRCVWEGGEKQIALQSSVPQQGRSVWEGGPLHPLPATLQGPGHSALASAHTSMASAVGGVTAQGLRARGCAWTQLLSAQSPQHRRVGGACTGTTPAKALRGAPPVLIFLI